mgnify:CR=1 FL=1
MISHFAPTSPWRHKFTIWIMLRKRSGEFGKVLTLDENAEMAGLTSGQEINSSNWQHNRPSISFIIHWREVNCLGLLKKVPLLLGLLDSMKFIAWLDHPPWLDYNLFVGYLLNTTIGYLMVGYHLSGYHFSGYSAIGYHVAGYHITGYLTLRKTREMFLAGAVDSRIRLRCYKKKLSLRKGQFPAGKLSSEQK